MNFSTRNNAQAYAPFTPRLPRFEYVAPPFAETVVLEGSEYAYDRRNQSPQVVEDEDE